MIFSKKYLQLILLFSLLWMVAKPQESMVFHRNFIGFSLSELAFVDYRFSYERRITPSHGIRMEVGYKPDFRNYTDATNIDLGQSPTAWCYRNTADWYYLSLGYRYYFDHKKTVYVSPEIFCKFMIADDIVYTYGVGGGGGSTLTNVYQIRSMHSSLAGANLLIGKRMRIRFSENANIGFDMFLGLSVRAKNIHTTIYGSTTISHYHDSSPSVVYIPFADVPVVTNEFPVQLSGQFGIILYVSWK
jgi:hypothetical protein